MIGRELGRAADEAGAMMEHTTRAFDIDLQDLARLVAEMGGLAEKQIGDSVDALNQIMDQDHLLDSNPLLERSIHNRFPYLDPLNHVQVELLKLHRGRAASEKVLTGVQLTINGVSAGLRNSG